MFFYRFLAILNEHAVFYYGFFCFWNVFTHYLTDWLLCFAQFGEPSKTFEENHQKHKKLKKPKFRTLAQTGTHQSVSQIVCRIQVFLVVLVFLVLVEGFCQFVSIHFSIKTNANLASAA